MIYEKFCKIWLCIIVVGISSIFLSSIIVDPIDILSTPIIRGINNYKSKQDSYLDVFKPYQIVRNKPDVVFIGSSRVYYAWDAKLDGFKNEKVYNLGFSSLPLDNMDKYLDFVYKVHKPQKIFIGLDLFQFSKETYNNPKRNFSQNRLDRLSTKTKNEILFESLKENFQVSHLIGRTIKDSFKHKNDIEIFERGWYASRGNCLFPNKESYYSSINGYINNYSNFSYEPKSMLFLESILTNAKKNNVETYVFFNPISVDLLALIKIFELDNDLNRIKKQVTNIFGIVYDFNYINPYTLNREKFFYDASHSNKIFGSIQKTDILLGEDTYRMKVLTPYTIDTKLHEEIYTNNQWFEDNYEYISYLKTTLGKSDHLVQGKLKKFIGF